MFWINSLFSVRFSVTHRHFVAHEVRKRAHVDLRLLERSVVDAFQVRTLLEPHRCQIRTLRERALLNRDHGLRNADRF